MSGKPLLDQVISTLQSEIVARDIAYNRNFLAHFAPLAYVRPQEFLTLIEKMVASLDSSIDPKPDLIRQNATILGMIPSVLGPVLADPELRARALELLAQIAETQNFEDRAGTGAFRVFTEKTQYPSDGNLLVLWRTLEVLRGWWLSHGPLRLQMISGGISQLLSLEARFVEFRGLNAVFVQGRVPLTKELQRLRSETLDLLKVVLRDPSMSVRRRGVDVLHDAVGEIVRAASGLERLVTAESEPEIAPKTRDLPSPPNVTDVTEGGGDATSSQAATDSAPAKSTDSHLPTLEAPKTAALTYLDTELERFFCVVENVLASEREPHILDRLVSVVHWHVQFKPDTLAGLRARKIEDQIRKMPQYRLYAAVAGERAHSVDDAEINALLTQVTGHDNANAFADELETIAKISAERALAGGARVLLRLGSKHPAFARKLLDVAVGEQPRLPIYLLGSLIAGIRVSGDVDILSGFASGSLEQKRMAAVACTRIRPAWHPGFELTNRDIHVIRSLLSEPDKLIRRELLTFLPALVEDLPTECLQLAEFAASESPGDFVEQIAQILFDALKIAEDSRNDKMREAVRKVFEYLRTANSIGGYYANAVLADLARTDLVWFFDFLSERVEYAEDNDIPAYKFEAVPRDFARAFTGSRVSDDVRGAALTQALGWLSRSPRFSAEVPNLVHGLLGDAVPPLLVGAIRALLSEGSTVGTLEQVSMILDKFRDDEVKFSLLGECLASAHDLSQAEELSVLGYFSACIGHGLMKWTPGQIPPALLRRLELLEKLKREYFDKLLVVKFVEIETISVRQEIARVRDQDEELLVEYE